MSERRTVPIRVEYSPTFHDYLWLTIIIVWRRLKWFAWLARPTAEEMDATDPPSVGAPRRPVRRVLNAELP